MSGQEVGGSLRIAFIVDYFPALSETFILNQITGLIDRGHTVDIFARYQWSEDVVHPDVERYGLLGRTRHFTLPRNPFVRAALGARMLIANVPRRPALLRAMNVVRYGRSAIALHILYAAVLFQRRYDIVHCQYGTNGEVIGAALKELGLQQRLVTTFHGTDIRLAQRRGIGIYRRLLALGDCFIAISDYSRQQLLAWGVDPGKVVYHPVGIDCRVFACAPQMSNDTGRDISIVTVARLVPEKAVHNGILAVSKLLRDRPDLRLRYDIVGDGPLRGELTGLIRRLGLDGVVRMRGPLQQDAVVEILRRSDVFVLSSIAEVLPVVLMEAQAMGLPVIATRVGAVDEIVLDERSGFLVPPGDVEALAGKLQRLIARPQVRVEFGERGRRHVLERFDVNALNDRLVQIYRRVLDGGLPFYVEDAARKADGTYAVRA